MQIRTDARARVGSRLHRRAPGLTAQGLRFAAAGAAVALVYIATTTTLADGFQAPFQIALVIGFATGLAVHFTLQRVFVWADRETFALALHQQLWRYLLLAAVQYGATALITAFVPTWLGLSTTLVYLVTVAAITACNFVIFRQRLFHAPR